MLLETEFVWEYGVCAAGRGCVIRLTIVSRKFLYALALAVFCLYAKY